MLKRVAAIALLMMLAGGSGGCFLLPAHMQRFDLEVKVDQPPGETRSVAVDIMVLPNAEVDALKDQNLKEWFNTDSKRIAKAKNGTLERMTISSSTQNPQLLVKDNAMWDTWEKQNLDTWNLVIFTDLGDNPPRLVLPLSSKRWDKPSRVTVTISPGAIQSNPQPSAP